MLPEQIAPTYKIPPATWGYAATPGPLRLEGEHHQIGICGGNADLCGQRHGR